MACSELCHEKGRTRCGNRLFATFSVAATMALAEASRGMLVADSICPRGRGRAEARAWLSHSEKVQQSLPLLRCSSRSSTRSLFPAFGCIAASLRRKSGPKRSRCCTDDLRRRRWPPLSVRLARKGEFYPLQGVGRSWTSAREYSTFVCFVDY